MLRYIAIVCVSLVSCFRAKQTQGRVRHMEAKRVRGEQEREKVQQYLENQMKEELVKQTVSGGDMHSYVKPHQYISCRMSSEHLPSLISAFYK